MKKIMVLLLATTMLFASIGCSNGNGPDSSSGGNGGETISVDLTNEKWLARFEYNSTRGNYGKSFKIKNHEEFKVGDKLDVKVKLEVSRNIASLKAGIFYLNDDGDLVFIGNQECDVEVKRNIKAGEEFVASFTYNVTKENIPADKELRIEFRYNGADADEKTFIESNISDIFAEQTHFKVSSTAQGLKIEIKEVPGETRVKDSGSSLSFYVDGKKLPVSIAIDNEHKGAETFIYPFVSKDDVVYVEYYEVYQTASKQYSDFEFVKVKSEYECLDIEDYVDLEKLYSIKPKLRYDAYKNKFFFGFDTPVNSAKEIFIGGAGNYQVNYVLLSGEKDWSNTEWLVSQEGVFVDENGEFVIYDDAAIGDYEEQQISFFTAGKNLNLPFASWRAVDYILESIVKHGNKYWGSIETSIQVNNAWYRLPDLFTDTYSLDKKDLENVVFKYDYVGTWTGTIGSDQISITLNTDGSCVAYYSREGFTQEANWNVSNSSVTVNIGEVTVLGRLDNGKLVVDYMGENISFTKVNTTAYVGTWTGSMGNQKLSIDLYGNGIIFANNSEEGYTNGLWTVTNSGFIMWLDVGYGIIPGSLQGDKLIVNYLNYEISLTKE